MAYKLIAIDLDGTIIPPGGKISREDKAAVKKALDKGVQVVIASGRAYPGIIKTLKELQINGYTIANIGQVVGAGGEVLHANYLSPETTSQIMRFAALRNTHFQVYMDDTFHYAARNKIVDDYEDRCGYTGIEEPDLLEKKDLLAAKVVLIDDHRKLEQLRADAQGLFPDLTIAFSEQDALEFPAPDSKKGDALKYIGQKLEIEPSEMIAVGDSAIDLSMLQYAGLGAAVENAEEEIKNAADYIAPDCTRSPIADIVNKFL